MNKRMIVDKIINLIKEEVESVEVDKDSVINTLAVNERESSNNILSSLILVSVLVSIEREYLIEITDEEFVKFTTIDGLADIVYQKVSDSKI